MTLHHKKKISADLYVIKIGVCGNLKNSTPCKHCCIELFKNKKININKVHFSNENGEIESHQFKEWYKNNDHFTSYGWSCLRK